MGYKCNQCCIHCHVNAGPNRTEMMSSETIDLIKKVLVLYKIKTIDLTGGAPELHPEFRKLVITCREIGVEIIDRCNLTILTEPGQEDLADFLAANEVTVVASLPCYEEENVDKQRGKGVFEKSIIALKRLNKLGYGLSDGRLKLNLVYNPQGPSLPPDQKALEEIYRKKMSSIYGIYFSELFTITNMPINRFEGFLRATGQLTEYQNLLEKSFNKRNLDTVMCRNLLSVNWQGYLYDCDFNQQLGLRPNCKLKHLKDLLQNKLEILDMPINVDSHCFGCTAGSGSSCSGSLQ